MARGELCGNKIKTEGISFHRFTQNCWQERCEALKHAECVRNAIICGHNHHVPYTVANGML